MWHIAKRELYDNLNSLRFALATVLILALMLTNAIVYLREHPARAQAYHNAAANATKTLEARSTSLYRLAAEGPGDLHKTPSPLRFCAEGGRSLSAYTRRWQQLLSQHRQCQTYLADDIPTRYTPSV